MGYIGAESRHQGYLLPESALGTTRRCIVDALNLDLQEPISGSDSGQAIKGAYRKLPE
jgi:hypothetical protein